MKRLTIFAIVVGLCLFTASVASAQSRASASARATLIIPVLPARVQTLPSADAIGGGGSGAAGGPASIGGLPAPGSPTLTSVAADNRVAFAVGGEPEHATSALLPAAHAEFAASGGTLIPIDTSAGRPQAALGSALVDGTATRPFRLVDVAAPRSLTSPWMMPPPAM